MSAVKMRPLDLLSKTLDALFLKKQKQKKKHFALQIAMQFILKRNKP